METRSRMLVRAIPVIKGLVVGVVLGVLFLVAWPTGTAEAAPPFPSCGNENEDECGLFFWENGNFGCDRGLRLFEGKCINGLEFFGRARYQGAAGTFQSTWTYWALKNQRQQLARDVPIGKVMLLGAHNAFNNFADGYLFFPNQRFSITDQLRAGMRVVDLDIHAGGSLPTLCHGTVGHIGCLGTDRWFYNAIKEIRNWMNKPENSEEVIVILLEDYIDEDEDEFKVTVPIQVFLANDPNIGVFTPADWEARVGTPDDQEGSFPSQRELLERNKRVIVLAQNRGFGDTYIIRKTRVVSYSKGGQPVDNFEVYPKCDIADDFDTDPQSPLIAEVNGDQLLGGAEPVSKADLVAMALCNVDIINMDMILYTGITPGDRLKGAVWSWEEGDRGNNGDAAMLVGSTGRWRSAGPGGTRSFACRLDARGGSWRITASWNGDGRGPWVQGWDACEAEFGATAQFGVPVDGWQNRKLNEANPANLDLWLNYNDILSEGNWLINHRPQVTVTGPSPVDEGPSPVTYDFTATDDPGDTVTVGAPDCGAAGTFVTASLTTTATGGSFDCRFPNGPATSQVGVSMTETDGVGVSVNLMTANVTVNNVAPTVDAGPDQTMVFERELVSLAPSTFNDKGTLDTHTATIDWGDGTPIEEGTVTEAPFGPPGDTAGASGTVSGSHVYTEDGMHTVSVCVTDDDGGSSCDTLTVTVLSPEQVIENVINVLQGIVDAEGCPTACTPLGDKVEDALAKAQQALDKLTATPPDNQGAMGAIEGAVGDLEASLGLNGPAVDAQLLDLMDQLAGGAARVLPQDAIDAAIAGGGDPVKIADAEQLLADGDALRAADSFKDAVATYKDAKAKAESASASSGVRVVRPQSGSIHTRFAGIFLWAEIR